MSTSLFLSFCLPSTVSAVSAVVAVYRRPEAGIRGEVRVDRKMARNGTAPKIEHLFGRRSKASSPAGGIRATGPSRLKKPVRFRGSFVSWAFLVLLGCFPAAGCRESRSRPDQAQAGEKVIRIAFSRIEQADLDLLRSQAARLERQLQGVKVEVVAQAWRTTDIHDLYSRFLALRDPSIDIYVIDDPWIPEFAFAGWILPLDRIEGWARRELHPAGLRSGMFRGKLYAVPFELSANALFYRRDLLDKHGFSPPGTMDELLSQARQIKEKENKEKEKAEEKENEKGKEKEKESLSDGLVLHAFFLHNDIYPFLWASGGGALDSRERIALDRRPNIEALTRLQEAFKQGKALPSRERMLGFRNAMRYGYHDAVQSFEKGSAVFMINWLRFAAAAEDPGSPLYRRLGVVPVPGLRPGKGGSTLGSWNLAVNAASRNPGLAMKVIRSLSSPKMVWERYEKLATFPPHRRYYEDKAFLAGHRRLRIAGSVLAHARSRLPLPNERELNEIVEETLTGILFRGEPVEKSLRTTAARMRRLVSDFPKTAPSFPARPKEAKSPAMVQARHLLLILGAIWALAVLLGIAYFYADRSRGLFKTLSLRFTTLGLAITMLALATGMLLSLLILVRSQERSIEEAKDIYRAAIVEHSRALGRQIALGASLIRESVDAARKRSSRTKKDDAHVESVYVQSLDVLTAEGTYSDDIIFLQVIRSDGTIVSDEQDFLGRKLVRGNAEGRPAKNPQIRYLARYSRSLMMRDVAQKNRPAYLEVLIPLIEQGRHAGVVRIGYSKKRQRERIHTLQSQQERLVRRGVVLVAGAGGVLVLLGALLLVLVARGVTIPLLRLQGFSNQVRQGDLTVRCDIPGKDELASLGSHMNSMVTGLKERERIREMFGRYLGPSVSEVILSEEVALGGEERQVTILFSDLRGFTTISESLTPVHVVHMLNVYFDSMVEAVFENNGMLDKFMGDGLMAVFGAPRPDHEHAMQAVRAALSMREKLHAVNARLASEGLPKLELGVGIHTGQAVLGNIGSSKRMEYTAIGDAVNLASRLEGLTKKYAVDIVISSGTQALVSNDVEADLLGSVTVKGKTHEVDVYSLKGIKAPKNA